MLIARDDGEHDRPYCQSCSRFYYFNPVPAACCFVPDGNKLLFVQRAVEPCKGMWTLPGGFVELGETAEEGALRELFEETNIVGRNTRLLGISTQSSRQSGSVIILGFLVDDWEGSPVAQSDASHVGFFPKENRPPIAFQAHKDLLEIYDSLKP